MARTCVSQPYAQAKRLEYQIEQKKLQLETQRQMLEAQRGKAAVDCTFWQQGRCIKGAACPFRHDTVCHRRACMCYACTKHIYHQAKAPKLSLDAALPSTTPAPKTFVARPDAPEFVPSAQAQPPRQPTAKPARAPPKRKQPEHDTPRPSVFARLELAGQPADKAGRKEEPAAKRKAKEGPVGPSRLLVTSLQEVGGGTVDDRSTERHGTPATTTPRVGSDLQPGR